jgi:di/tricarboxylate transporter
LDALLILLVVAIATALLATERMRADLVAMLVLAALLLLRVLDPDEALSGFSNQATVTVACMFVLSAGLQSSGVVQFLGDRLLHRAPSSTNLLVLMIGLVTAPVSAFINNTAAVAVFMPIVLRASQDKQISPSALMMPLSFFAMLGGTCTLIGTSTNILVSSIAEQRGHQPFQFFEFSTLGLLLLLAGSAYLLLVGRRLIPPRIPPESLTQGFHLNVYLSEVIVLADSPLIGSSVVEARLGARYDLEVLGHVRNKVMRSVPYGYSTLMEGDILLVKAPAAALVRLRGAAGLALRPGRKPGTADLHSTDSALVEAVIKPNSDLEGRTLQSVDFRNTFGATALAIRRHGEDIREKIGKLRLTVGDELLIVAPRRNLDRLRRQNSFVVLQELEVPVVKPFMATVALAIVGGVVLVATLGWYSIATAAIVGAILMVVSGCLPLRRVYQEVDWRVVFLLAGLIPLGLALESSGAAAWAVDQLLNITGDWGPRAVLSVFFLAALALTGVMSNTATAALLAPLAITLAERLHVDARPFLIALTFAASAAFYTPIGYQTNLLVFGPGGYRFADFVKVGGPLALLYWLMATLLIPLLFPF